MASADESGKRKTFYGHYKTEEQTQPNGNKDEHPPAFRIEFVHQDIDTDMNIFLYAQAGPDNNLSISNIERFAQ